MCPWDVYKNFLTISYHSITLLGNVNDFGSKHCASELSANHNILQVSNISSIKKTDSDDMRRGLALPEIYPLCALNLSSSKPTFAFFLSVFLFRSWMFVMKEDKLVRLLDKIGCEQGAKIIVFV